MSAIDRACSLAEHALSVHLPDRWLHVQGVASLAHTLGENIRDVNTEMLVQAAWLHDIGYSPLVAECGFHPLDGARFLEKHGIESAVVGLVAHHSAAIVEAQLRGISGMQKYVDYVTATRDALWYCDASIGPGGQRLTPSARWREVRSRYGPDSLVSRFLDEAEIALSSATNRTIERLATAGIGAPET